MNGSATSGMQPLQVTAHLESGIAHSAPWGIALDGLLASVIHHDAKATLLAGGGHHEPLAGREDVEDLDLPLARCTPSDEPWHWAATCAWPSDHDGERPDVRYWLGALDHRAVEQVVQEMPRVLELQRGRYRQHHMPLLVTVTRTVVWRCVGDLEGVRDLLGGVWAIGKKRAAGQGRVLRWEVEPATVPAWEAGHLHPDGTLGRPCPRSCVPEPLWADGVHGGYGRAGIRPPYAHPSRQHDLVLPALLEG